MEWVCNGVDTWFKTNDVLRGNWTLSSDYEYLNNYFRMSNRRDQYDTDNLIIRNYRKPYPYIKSWEYADGGYSNSGYFYTTELIAGIGGNTVALLTNASIPVGDSITVEFSPDNITWVDHNGNIGSDTIIAGNESIDIRDLSYTTLYARLNETDGGVDSTPRLYQLIVITNAFVGGGGVVVGGVSTGWILGIFILILPRAILISSKKRSK